MKLIRMVNTLLNSHYSFLHDKVGFEVIDGLIGLSVVILTGIGCLHVYWAFGGIWASTIVLPTSEPQKPTFVPGKIATLVVAFLVFFAALLLFLQGGLFLAIQPNFIVEWGCWVCVIAFG